MSWFCTYFICKLPVCLSRISYKPFFSVSVVVVLQSLSCVQHFAILWTAASQASLSFTFSWNLLKFLSVESVMPSNHLILCHPLLLLPSIFPSIRIFSNEWTLHQVAKVLVFQLQHHLDWFDLLQSKGLQHHSSKASILQCSAFCMVQLSHPYMTTGKNHSCAYTDLCRQSGVSAF